MATMQTRVSAKTAPAAAEIRRLLAASRYREALLQAAKFQNLGPQRDRILSAKEAYLRPAFQESLGKDPAVLIADGLKALSERFGDAA